MPAFDARVDAAEAGTVEAIELSFDSDSERRLSSLWAQLAAAYDAVGEGVVGVRPHISLAVFASGGPRDPASIVSQLGLLEPFSIEFREVDVFAGAEAVVLLKPARSKELLAAHDACMRALGAKARLVHPHYHAENWVPHCSVAVGVPESARSLVVQRCLEAEPFGTVSVCRVSFVRYRPRSELHTETLGAARAP